MVDEILEVKRFRELVLPAEELRVLGADYFVRDAATGEMVIYTVGKDDPSVVSRTLSRADVAQMIEDAEVVPTAPADWATAVRVTSSVASDVSVDFTIKGDEGTITTDVNVKSLDGSKVTGELSVDTTGNAATATKLKTARNIAGKSFDGSADIDITAEDVGAISEEAIGTTVAPLVAGLVPAANLPSYVDDVIEVDAYDKLPGQPNALPENGDPSKGKIYLVVTNTGTEEEPSWDTKIYRWSGTVYVNIIDGVGVADQALRLETARTIAMTGDGSWQVLFDGSQNVTAAFSLADVGIGAVDYGWIQLDAKGRVLFAAEKLTSEWVQSAASVAVVNPAW